MGTAFKKVRLRFHKVSVSINTRFTLLLWEAICRSRGTLCCGVVVLQARRVWARPQNGFLGVWYIGTVGAMRKDSSPPS